MPDEPIAYGDDCASCFAAGKTPEFVYVRFITIVGCDRAGPPPQKIPPNDRLFKLPQHPTIPCEWYYNQSGWEVEYRAFFPATGGSYLDLYDENGMLYFRDHRDACEPEGTVFHNEILDCLGADYGSGGIAVVTWSPQATQLLEDLNIVKSADLFMELFPRPDGKLVYKFCRIAESSNIKILLEP